ncbi:MAG: DNA-directed RNA polymerase subunit A' [Candidatus Diapherotrites archaeon]|uniref:DNA-directed RNA polymerase subunit n=1 Tax=Candidatus Iainarchaeum sp. TaxID=3101447 RepID=A0A938YTN4_9ARCH|nr:DNA-directed RNA polymerase subunit A' [Candidatus Diapherotrites archaeon]
MLMKKIQSINFKIISPEMVRKMSALEIKTPDTYDKDGYPMEGGLMDPHLGVINPGLRCKTCGQKMKQCPGHFGSLELVRPVIHSEFGRRLELLMHATCKECGRIALADDAIEKIGKTFDASNPDATAKKIVAKTKKVKKCPHCNGAKAKVLLDKPTNFFYNKERIYPTQIREWIEKIPENELVFFGYKAEMVKPEWFILKVLPVPPITIRPSITLESGIKSEDDLTHKLVDIIRINMRLKDNIDAGAPQLIIEDLWDLLQYHVTTYFDNNTAGVPPAKHRSGRALRTIMQRLKGKKGRFRHNLTGKRVNFAARSTITPDPFIRISEIGIPKEIADELTVPEIVTEWNKPVLQSMVKNTDKVVYVIRPDETRKKVEETNRKEIADEIDVGFKLERKLQDGDIVLFNRQPSLHRLSMLAHKVRVMPDRTFKINPIVCKPYNADFDGDEMNVHVPQTEEGKAEATELMFVRNQVISPRYGAPVIILDEDGVSGIFVLTLKSTEFEKEEAMKHFYEIGITSLPKPDRDKKYSGKLIFSQLLPQDLSMEYKTNMCRIIQKTNPCSECKKEKCPHDAYLKIEKGKLLCGVVDKESLGEARGKLVDALARNYDSSIIEEFYYRVNRIIYYLLTSKGMTVGLDEYKVSDNVKRERSKATSEMMKRGNQLVESYRKGTLEHIPGRNIEESFEISMMQLAAHTKDKIEKLIMKEKLEPVLKEKPKLNTMVMIVSGSRGSSINLMNISGFWGQASVREGRPKRGYQNRLITLNEKEDVGVTAGGFIENNFMDGMPAKEFFYHSMGGRQGEVDTGVSTKVSGYLYRRLANSLKDLVVNNDSTVRTAEKNIIQFAYGEDGVFPQKSIRGKSVNILEEFNKIKAKDG